MLNDQRALIRSLSTALKRNKARLRIFETHISWVLVTQHFAFKIKKAVQFDFLDFSTLDARHYYCQEELRLNSRLAPELYLGVVAIVGTLEAPVIEAPGVPLEYAVKMRAFPQQAIWSERLRRGRILPLEMDALASKLAQFHDHAAVAAANSAWGSPDTIRLGACDNLASIASLVDEAPEKEWVADMQTWQEAQQEILADTFESRKARGRIRECHGDLHCGNILTINDRVGVFDCIEFNESLRWIDVMDDMAFICMDLKFQKRPDLAARLLNRYLEISGDYEGLAVLRYYQVERALVRCKVTLLRGRQVRADAQDATSYVEQAAQYMAFSSENIKPATVALVITHGYSGSGKSAIARCLVEFLGAIQIRSDVERKRMHGLSAISSAAAAPGAGLYDVAATNLTYGRLRALARHVIESGLPVIVDAACLRQEQRCQFERLARELAVPFFILDVQASEATIRERIVLRAQSGRDPSDAGLHILAYQVAHHDRFSDDELKHVISVDGETCWTMEAIRDIAAPIRRALSAGTCA